MLQPDAVEAFLQKLQYHIEKYQLRNFSISFHGGEPTLFPKQRFKDLCERLIQIGKGTRCQIKLAMQTNALLIDDEWLQLLKTYRVVLGISIDGNQHLHDKYRIDHKGRGTYQKTIAAINRIRNAGINIYILSVVNNEISPKELLNHFVEGLQLKNFDLLLPHLHHEHEPHSLINYLRQMYDLYINEYVDKDVNIRLFDDLMSQSIGGGSRVQGYGFISTVTLLTDGKLEATDDLRMIDGLTPSNINIKSHDLQQVTEDPLWQEIYNSSINLASPCNQCEFKQACGGGQMVSRWSKENRFNNVSFYCEDYKALIKHIKYRLKPYMTQLECVTLD